MERLLFAFVILAVVASAAACYLRYQAEKEVCAKFYPELSTTACLFSEKPRVYR